MNQLEEFKALGLSDDILTAIAKKGFETPSAIQSLTIPHLLTTDKDIIAQAQTGTGKTAAFGLPIIQMLTSRRNIPQAIVLVPTRELALQVTQELISFNTHDLSIAPIYGGASMTEQLRRLKKGIDIVVGTPGRILDHIRRGTLDLSAIAYLVLDEADEMLNMGFIEDIEEIMHAMTGPKRVLLFSATMPDRIAALARNYMHDPDLLKVESQHVTTDLTNQIYFEVREGDKFDALTRIIDVEPEFYGIVFSRTRTGADEIVAKLLERGYAAEVLHGDISQTQREKILGKFKKKQVNILVATDVAARGIDVSNLTHVINYSLPQDSDSYVHRIGRTGRAGCEGAAWSFCSEDEFDYLKDIQKLTGLTIPVEGPVPEFAARQNAAPAQKPARKAAPKPAQKPARNAEPAPARTPEQKPPQEAAEKTARPSRSRRRRGTRPAPGTPIQPSAKPAADTPRKPERKQNGNAPKGDRNAQQPAANKSAAKPAANAPEGAPKPSSSRRRRRRPAGGAKPAQAPAAKPASEPAPRKSWWKMW